MLNGCKENLSFYYNLLYRTMEGDLSTRGIGDVEKENETELDI